MSPRHRKTRPVVLLLAGWFLIGIVLVAHTIAHAGFEGAPALAPDLCPHPAEGTRG